MTRNDEVVGPRGLSRTSVSPCACQSLQRRLNRSAVRWCFTRPRQAIFFSPEPGHRSALSQAIGLATMWSGWPTCLR